MAKTLLEVAELVQSCAKLARGAKTQNLEDGNFFGVKFQVAMLPCYPGFCTSGVHYRTVSWQTFKVFYSLEPKAHYG